MNLVPIFFQLIKTYYFVKFVKVKLIPTKVYVSHVKSDKLINQRPHRLSISIQSETTTVIDSDK